jgi:elongation factor P
MNATDIRKGIVLIMENGLFVVEDFQHVTPGNWRGFVAAKLRDLKKGSSIQYRFRSTDKVEAAFLERKPSLFLYREGDSFCFMDQESYEQVFLSQEQVGEASQYLVSDTEVDITYVEEEMIGIELPKTVTLTVTETVPGVKGNTVSNMAKTATLETGLVIKVPLFINQEEKVKVDTRTGEFAERA